MLGLMGVGMYGWYLGLEAFVFGGVSLSLVFIALTLFTGLVIGAGWLVYNAYQRYAARRVAPVLAPVKSYFAAEDVPETPESTD